MDKRHKIRINIVQELFATGYKGTHITRSKRTNDVLSHTERLDKLIVNAATKYDIDKIAKVDLSILRLALYELTIEKKIPPKVIINEAVELGKELGGDRSPAFVNAVLGKIYEDVTHEKTKKS